MTDARCATPIPLEEHLFVCAECSGRISTLVNLAEAIKQEFREGRVGSVLTVPFVQQLKQAGMRVREYHLQPGGSVNCTVAPEDDLVVSHLAAPLRDVQRLDLIFEGEGWRQRLQDIAFDPASGEVVFVPSVAELRKMGVSANRAHLVAVGPGAERVIGHYTFNHSPYR
jgi:hypothetical protein